MRPVREMDPNYASSLLGAAPKSREALTFPASFQDQIIPYTPSSYPLSSTKLPVYTTLTFATSLDSNLAVAPGTQTALSGPLSKAMTHYLRSTHDAILIGAGTAIADNPSLNCRIEGTGGYGDGGLDGQPRPVIIDPRGRWELTAESKSIKLAKEKRGKGPWIVTTLTYEKYPRERLRVLEEVGGDVISIPADDGRIQWRSILDELAIREIKSVMIEGGGYVINELLSPKMFPTLSSVIVTVAPTWLGKGGVQVCPEARTDDDGARVPVARLKDVVWVPLGEDVVLCGRPNA